MQSGDREMPERLGRYEIVERLAAGGMGEVFIARFLAPGGFVKPVAIKRIHPHLTRDAQFVHMLHDEARVTASVQHPNIVATVDVGEDGGSHFIVLDYISGDPLSRLVRELRVRNTTMPPWVVAWVGAQVASALHAAHEARSLTGESLDIIHRDISPGNIILSDSGHPMLFDFGVAKAKERMVKTAHGVIKGKLPYMAPETLRGVPVDRSVDIFGLGVTLYELLTNVSPYLRATQADTLLALRSGVVPSPGQGRPHIDSRLDSIVMMAMAPERSQRYATAAQLEGALRAWARAMGAPHEPGPVANWLGSTFPERQSARRALLGRVASLTRPAPSNVGESVRLSVPSMVQSGPMFHQISSSAPISPPQPQQATPAYGRGYGQGTPELKETLKSAGMESAAAGVRNVVAHNAAYDAEGEAPTRLLEVNEPRPRSTRALLWLSLAVGAMLVGGLLAYLVFLH